MTYLRKIADAFSQEVPEKPSELLANLSKTSGVDGGFEKSAIAINLDPSSLIGAITGAAAGKRTAEKRIAGQHEQDVANTVIHGGYYKQVENIMNNMYIIFSPFSVIYQVRNGVDRLVIDTITLDEMTSEMRTEYDRKNKTYFKNLFAAKVGSEIQLAEQDFARRLLNNKILLSEKLTKNASDASDDVFEPVYKGPFDHIADYADFILGAREMAKQAEDIPQVLEVLAEMDGNVELLDTGFDSWRPFEKLAMPIINSIAAFFGADTNDSDVTILQKHIADPGYMNRNVVVGFLPDRVVFVLDNISVAQLPLVGMNEEGFKAFNENDDKYFKKFFIDSLKKKSEVMNKTAADFFSIGTLQEFFTKSNVHPYVYLVALAERLGEKWAERELPVIIKDTEIAFDLKEPICDAALNKIMSIWLCNQAMTPYVNAFTFEKVIRTLIGRPIDFLEKEDSLTASDMITGICIMDQVTPADDIFDNFSEEVFNYIAETSVKNGDRVVWPQAVTGSLFESEFYSMLNVEISEILNDRAKTEHVHNSQALSEALAKNKMFFEYVYTILNRLRDGMTYNLMSVSSLCDIICKGVEHKPAIQTEVEKNLAIDIRLQATDIMKDEQIQLYRQLARR